MTFVIYSYKILFILINQLENMKKIFLTLVCCSALVACSKENQQTTQQSANTSQEQPAVKQTTQLTPDEVVQKFKDSGINILKLIIYTEETDPNNQLGRPNQYIAKANWADASVEQSNPEGMIGGTIEVFTNENDLNHRKTYIEEITKNMPMVNQYIYENGLYLLRLDKELTPTQAKKYQEVFMKL